MSDDHIHPIPLLLLQSAPKTSEKYKTIFIQLTVGELSLNCVNETAALSLNLGFTIIDYK